MNIPPETARAQGHHGAKGGRPRLELTESERLARRREQKRTSRMKRATAPQVIAKPAPNKHVAPYVQAPFFDAEAPKPGRNEPCPCGSGRKFKKCCG
jgi:uncharacterized protein YecA (UPF0149 family)